MSVFGVRLEGCPFLWRSAGIAAGPCAGVDLGALHAAGQDALAATDTGFWGAASVHARIRLALGAALTVESQLGANVPFVRYEMGPRDGSAVWFRTESVGLAAGVGLGWNIE